MIDFAAFIQFDRLGALPVIAIASILSTLLVIFSYKTNAWLLISLRVIAIVLLLFCILEPNFIIKEIKAIRPNLVMLLDSSQSMSIQDEKISNSQVSRFEAVKDRLLGRDKENNGILKEFSNKFETRLYQFNSNLVGIENLQHLQNLKATGNSTDISKAISKVVEEQRGEKLAGIVLISDGRINVGSDPSQEAKKFGVPIYAVGVGNPKAPKDIQVVRAEAPPIVYVDRPFSINVILKSSGYEKKNGQIGLFEGKTLRDSKLVALSEAKSTQNVTFQVKPQKEGDYAYTVSVEPILDELTLENNKRTIFTKAVKSKLKLLYLDGTPSWEYRFLKRALEKDEDIDPTFVLGSPNDAYLASKNGGYYPQYMKFPESSKELFRYDVIIIGNVSTKFFNPRQLQAITDFVEKRGGGLLFLGGEESLGANGLETTSLKKLLPVNVPPRGSVVLEEDFNLILTADGFFHPIMRLEYSKAENESIWRDLPALKRAFADLQPKAGATVLAKHQKYSDYPVIVFQRYAKGKVLLVATDSSWNWGFGVFSYKKESPYYRRFWTQTIRWLATESEAKLVNLELDKQEYELGEEAEISVRVYDQSYEPISEAKVELTMETPLGATFGIGIPAASNSEVKGLYSAKFQPTASGSYTLYTKASYSQLELGSDSKSFAAHYPKLEFEDPREDEAMLKKLSETSGGSYLTLAELSQLPQKISYHKQTEELSQKSEIWNNPALLLLAAALLGGEWILRKRRGLI